MRMEMNVVENHDRIERKFLRNTFRLIIGQAGEFFLHYFQEPNERLVIEIPI